MATMDPLMDAKALAEYLQVSILKVRRMTDAKEIPSIKMGRLIRYRQSDVVKWLEESTRRKK